MGDSVINYINLRGACEKLGDACGAAGGCGS
jgi:hypothetical protein